MAQQAAQPLNYKALSWTIGAHAALLLLFALWRFATPAAAAPLPEMGMEVNLGTSDDGSGTDQPMDVEEPAPTAAAGNTRSAAPEQTTAHDIEQTDEADAPAVAPPVKPARTPVEPVPQKPVAVKPITQPSTAQQTRPAAAERPQKPRFVYQGSTGNGGNGAAANSPGSGEGNTTGPGDRGVPHGTPGASNYTGSPGTGTGGISYALKDRSIVSYPAKEAEFREGGKVVVRITVNREGVIVNKNVVSASNAELSGIALRKLGQVKFNRNEDAPAEQFGNITFVFKGRN